MANDGTYFPITATGWLPRREQSFEGLQGVTLEKTRTRFRCELQRDGHYIVASTPIAGGMMAKNAHLFYDFGISPSHRYVKGSFVQQNLACTVEGTKINARSIKGRDNKTLLVGIKEKVAMVTLFMGPDYGEFKKYWMIRIWTFGESSEGRVRIHEKIVRWEMRGAFGDKLIGFYKLIGIKEAESRYPNLEDLTAMIRQNIEQFCRNEEVRDVLLPMSKAMAVTFLRACLIWAPFEDSTETQATPEEPATATAETEEPVTDTPEVRAETEESTTDTAETPAETEEPATDPTEYQVETEEHPHLTALPGGNQPPADRTEKRGRKPSRKRVQKPPKTGTND